MDHVKWSLSMDIRNCGPYLVYGAWPFIVMNMAIKCYIDLVFLPKLLQAFPSHGLFKWALHTIPVIRGIAKDSMSSKNQPWLFPPIYGCKALLNEPILFRSLSPVMFTVGYAETEHTIICWIPTNSKKCNLCISDSSQIDLAADMLRFKENVEINNLNSNEKAVRCHLMTRKWRKLRKLLEITDTLWNLPKLSSVLSWNIVHGLSQHTTFTTWIHTLIERAWIWPITFMITTAGTKIKIHQPIT